MKVLNVRAFYTLRWKILYYVGFATILKVTHEKKKLARISTLLSPTQEQIIKLLTILLKWPLCLREALLLI